MRALEELPTATKNLIVPVVRVRPWLTAADLDRAIERIREAIGDRTFGLDLDTGRRGFRDGAAYEAFEALFDPNDGWSKYYDFVCRHNAVPVLRIEGELQILRQVEHVISLDRGVFIRIDVQNHRGVGALAQAFRDVNNVVFVMDCGWRDHLLPLQATCAGLVRTVVDVSDKFEIVVAGGDFPASGFDRLGPHFRLAGEERPLVDAVRRAVNEADIVFGDWASTRAPSTDNQIMRSRPRLDMPTRDGWECWRAENGDETFQTLAQAASRSRGLGEVSDLWGEQMIIATSVGADPSIRSQTTAASVRINLHMTLQAHFDEGRGPQMTDERVVGEL